MTVVFVILLTVQNIPFIVKMQKLFSLSISKSENAVLMMAGLIILPVIGC